MTENLNRYIKSATTTLANPFPGLRPFTVEESHLFFGREGQCETVLQYLAVNRFAAVTGASGSGKSSLIYCGLIPALYGGFIANAGSRWKIITAHPGNSPVENLAESIATNERSDASPEDLEYNKQIIYTVLRRSSFGLVNAVKQIKLAEKENILLIIDQFEELFRFKESRKDITVVNETEAYIKLLVNAISQKDQPIYLVLTMRSDFIGECSQFQSLTQLINQSNFLIPQMTRDDFKQAIIGPLAVGGAEIDPQLLQQVLNAIEDKSDQLPVLQHAMMRTWEFWSRNNETRMPLRIRDYEAAGRVENALSMHANEAFEELDEEGKEICKSMFKCLTEKGADNKGTRHPATVKHIAEIAKAPDQKVIDTVNKFRAKGRSFLTPVENLAVDKDTVIDISHESLMRIWDKLKNWVEEEFSSVQMYLRLAEASSLYQIGKTGLWRPPDLHLAINWRKTQKPTLAWARKYNPAFEKVMVFLDASEKKYLQEEQNKVRLQRMELNRTRKFATTMLLAAVAFLFISVWGFQQRTMAIRQARVAESNREEAEFRKRESDSLRVIAQGQADLATIEAMIQKTIADSAERESTIALLQSQISEQQRRLANQQAETAKRESQLFQQEKVAAQKTAEQALAEKGITELEKTLELQKRMLSTAQNLAIKSGQTEDRTLKALLAYQAFLFNRDYSGPTDPPDIYNALYRSLAAFNGDNYNGLSGHEGTVRSVAFLPSSAVFYSTGGEGKVLRWDLNSSTRSYRTIIDNAFINKSLAISPNGRWLANAGNTAGIQLFNLNQDNATPTILEGHTGWVEVLCFTPDSRGLFSASTDRTVVYWDLINNTKTVFTAFTNTKVTSMAVSPAGNYLFTGTDDGRLIRWNISTKEQTILFNAQNNTIYSIAINSTGSRLAFGDVNGTLRILDARTNATLQTILAHNARILDIKFSPNEQQIATASMDKTVKLWDAGNMSTQPVIIDRHNAFVFAVAFSPDGRYLVSSGEVPTNRSLTTLYYWPTRASFMAEQICGKVDRNMNQREWESYVGDVAYQKTCPNKE